MSKQAMEMALDALEKGVHLSYSEYANEKVFGPAIAALKEAIKQQDSPNYSLGEPVLFMFAVDGRYYTGKTEAACRAMLRASLIDDVTEVIPLYASAPTIPEGWQLVEKKELEKACLWMQQAAEDIADWGGYASEYFQEKHGLQSDIETYVERAGHLYKLLAAAPKHENK